MPCDFTPLGSYFVYGKGYRQMDTALQETKIFYWTCAIAPKAD
jgi:hypothetical protein